MYRLFDILQVCASKTFIIRQIDGTIEYTGVKEDIPYDLLNIKVKRIYANDNKIDIVLDRLSYNW